MIDVSVVIATFGDDHWRELAERARLSVPVGAPVILEHGTTLHGARNAALDRVETEWVCHLDADDELEPGYFEAMATATADLRAPSVRYVWHGRAREPWMPQVAGHKHQCVADCLPEGNWLVVGSLVRTDLVRSVGGWRDFAVYEDWDLWLRCWQAGATVEPVPRAIYRAHARRDSRNRGRDMAFKNDVHAEIIAANFPERAVA